MKVFISWSGDLSHKIALVLKDWLPTVLQSVECWVSSEDIGKGKQWNVEISGALKESDYGLICLVPNNVHEPWLNFEAGVISKSLTSDKVCPFLFGLTPKQLSGPLSLFQCTEYSKEEVRKLLYTLNAASPSAPISAGRLNTVFELCWPGLEISMNALKHSDLAGGKVTYLDKRSEIYEHALYLLQTAEQRVRVVQFFGGPRPPDSYAEKAAGILRSKRDIGIDVTYDAHLVIPPSRIPDNFDELTRKRFEIYANRGVGDLIDVYILKMEYPPAFGFDMFIVDRKHAHVSFTTSWKLDGLQRGITFEDQEPVVGDLIEWFETAIAKNSEKYPKLKSAASRNQR